MTDIRVVVAGEVTEEFKGSLYNIIDRYNLPGDRDAVIDVFDKVMYYTNMQNLKFDIHTWLDLFEELRRTKGLTHVEFIIGQDEDEDEES